MGHNQANQNIHCGSPRKGRERERRRNNILRNNGRKHPKCDQRHDYRHPRRPTNSKEDKPKETNTKTQYN